MTYCVAMRLDAGLVFLSDSRTNAGVDAISTFRKMTVFEREGDRVMVLLTAGNLAISQAVRQVLTEARDKPRSLWTARDMFEAATIVGEAVREVYDREADALAKAKIDFNVSIIFGGQIGAERPRLFNVYAAGNFIEATPENPYFQIGEAKYGKPIIDRVVSPGLPLDEAAKCALISMDSTLKSNISVGLPLDLLVYETNSLRHSVHELRLTPRSGQLQQVDSWQIHAPGNLTRATDGFGNVVHHFTLGSRTDDVTIDARGIVEAFPSAAPGSRSFTDAPGEGRYRVSPLYFLSTTPLTSAPPEMIDFAREHALVRGDADSALSLARAIAQRVRYKPNTTDVGTTAAEAFNLSAGVCQDQAQVMVACCRALGVPARYVSGYFHAAGEEDLASHAWVDVCQDAESHTWCSIDVTHQCFTDGRHIRLAVGRDYQSAAPIRGVRQGGGAETLDVSISIEPLPAEAA